MKSKIIVTMLLICVLSLVFASSALAEGDCKNLVCFCTNKDHAFVSLHDCKTEDWNARGLYPVTMGSRVEAPALPHAGVEAPATSVTGTGASSSYGGSSGMGGAETLDCEGQMQDDTHLMKSSKCMCYEIGDADYNKAADYVNSYPREYRLLSQNCMDFTESVADHLGLDLPTSDFGWLISDPGWFGGTFYDTLNAKKVTYNMTGSFIAYGTEKSLFGGRIVPGTEEPEKVSYAEEYLYDPDAMFTELTIGNPAEMVELTLSEERVVYGNPIEFSADLIPEEYSLVWWNLGNGERVFGPTPMYTYEEVGTYTVEMRYFDESKTVYQGFLGVEVHKDRIDFDSWSSSEFTEVPTAVAKLVGSERIELFIEAEDGPKTYGILLNGNQVEDVIQGGINDPTMRLSTTTEVVDAIADSPNRENAMLMALNERSIAMTPLSFKSSVKTTIAKIGTKALSIFKRNPYRISTGKTRDITYNGNPAILTANVQNVRVITVANQPDRYVVDRFGSTLGYSNRLSQTLIGSRAIQVKQAKQATQAQQYTQSAGIYAKPVSSYKSYWQKNPAPKLPSKPSIKVMQTGHSTGSGYLMLGGY